MPGKAASSVRRSTFYFCTSTCKCTSIFLLVLVVPVCADPPFPFLQTTGNAICPLIRSGLHVCPRVCQALKDFLHYDKGLAWRKRGPVVASLDRTDATTYGKFQTTFNNPLALLVSPLFSLLILTRRTSSLNFEQLSNPIASNCMTMSEYLIFSE